MISVVFSVLVSNAQAENTKTESVKIYGNCGMCKSTIEKAGNMKNQASVDWNKETKMATISFDSLITSKEEILKRIALAGYDSDIFLAPNDTYLSLAVCCQYERAQKTEAKTDEMNMVMEIETKDHSMHSNEMTKMQEKNPLSAVFDTYFAVKDALVKTDGNTASAKATDMLSAINEVKMETLKMDVHMVWMKVLENLKEDVSTISLSKDTKTQRASFDTLSESIYKLIKISKQETPTYYQHCPMANEGQGANWLSKEETIKNPYYGSQMLSCGKTVESIKE
jgi:copper chaperone CopZ/phosphopantetheinyl transferase (holo-ACP synthase)